MTLGGGDSSTGRVAWRARLRGRDSLAARMLAASTVIAAVVAVVFAVLVFAIASLRAATNRESEAREVTAATLSLQKIVLDLDTAGRGYALTTNVRFLTPREEARSQLRPALVEFERVAARGARRDAARRLVRVVREYVTDYADPLLQIAERNPALARSPLAVQEGQKRIGTVRRAFATFLEAETAAARANAAAANARSRRATAIGIAGVIASTTLILLLGLYLARSVGRPLRRVAAGAARIAGGDLSLRLPERGGAEVGLLTRTFNAMATQLAARQHELEAQNEQLRRSEAQKSELISIVSHEVRTPLASVLGFTSLLLHRDVDPEARRRYLEIIDAQGKRLASLLDDFLDVQQLDEGNLDLEATNVDVAALLREQVEFFSAAGAGTHAVNLELEHDPLVVRGDPDRLAQVIGNLLSNAIKYSPAGGRVDVVATETNGDVRVSVRDEGVGIPQGHHDEIFTKFFRGDAAASGITGTGLGLAFSRAVVEAHGGRIDFTSAPGKGSTFWVDLPAENKATNGDRQ